MEILIAPNPWWTARRWLTGLVLSGHVAGALLGCARQSADPASRPAVTTSAAPRTPPPAEDPTGAKAFNWIAPSGWADMTVYVRGMSPDNVAALSGPGSAAIIARMSTSGWTRFEDVPTAAVNEIVLRTLTEMAREYQDVRLIATQPATLSRLPAHMGEFVATKEAVTFHFRWHFTFHRKQMIQVNQVARENEWSSVLPVFDQLVADFRLPVPPSGPRTLLRPERSRFYPLIPRNSQNENRPV